MVAVFLVKVILFMMSRRVDDVGVPLKAERVEKRTAPYSASKSSAAQNSPAKKQISVATISGATSRKLVGATGEDTVTREEMLKLFGRALRVR